MRNPSAIATPRTHPVVERLKKNLFNDSYALLAETTGLNVAAVFRLAKGQRPATSDQIGRIVRILPKEAALELMTAFLSDVAAATGPEFAVTVSKR